MFTNPWPTWRNEVGAWGFLRHSVQHARHLPDRLWGKWASDAAADVANVPFINTSDADLANPPPGGAQAVWAGHASVVLQLCGATVLIDPMWSERIPPMFARNMSPPFALEALGRVDFVLITHNHYDHLDYGTVVSLRRLYDPVFLVPAGLKTWFTESGFEKVEEMRWWQEREAGPLTFAFVPAQHWSRRSLFDTNKSWWGGWVIKSREPAISVYHSGDTGYCPVFPEIGQKYGPFDLSFIPISPVEPRKLVEPQHVGPKEAIMVHQEVRSKRSVGIHWGTFLFGLDLPATPARVLRQYCEELGLQEQEFSTVAIGELLKVNPSPVLQETPEAS